MTRKRNYVIDNRDTVETWLHIEQYEGGHGHLRVNPWDLVIDVICNVPLHSDQVGQFLDRLERLKTDLELSIDDSGT